MSVQCDKAVGVRLWVGFALVVILGFFVTNFVQAHQNGGGIGIGDTRTVDDQREFTNYLKDHPLRPNSPR